MRAVPTFALAILGMGLGPGCTPLLPPWDGGGPLDAPRDARSMDVPIDAAPACRPGGMDCPPGYLCMEIAGLLRCVPERDGGPDAPTGVDAPVDAPRVDAPPDAGPMLPPATNGAGAPSNFSCLGMGVAPPAGSPVATLVRLRGVVGGGNAISTPFWMFPSNVVGTSCSAPSCTSLTTDTLGRATATLTGAWFAYRVPRTTSWLESVGVNGGPPIVGGPGTPTLSTMSNATQDMLHLAYGIPRQMGSGAVHGTLRDCDAAVVSNVVVRFSARGAELVPGAIGDAFVGYFLNATTPAPMATFTGMDGGFYGGNLAPSVPATVEAFGVLSAGSPLVRLACEELPLLVDGASFILLRPLRSDYPVGHPCRSP